MNKTLERSSFLGERALFSARMAVKWRKCKFALPKRRPFRCKFAHGVGWRGAVTKKFAWDTSRCSNRPFDIAIRPLQV